MKKYIIGVFLMSVLISLSVFYSCRKQTITDSSEITAKGGKLTIENARKIFEKQQSTTKAGSVEQELFDPGDYTMLWDDAQWGMNDVIESVDVPINSNDKYFVWQRKVYAGDTVFVRIPTTQRMVVFKNRSLDTTISYLLTLIPDGDYYINNRTYDEHFLHGGDKGNYTGWAAYHTLGGEFVAAYGYDNGKCIKLRTFKTSYDDSLLLSASLDIMLPEKVSKTKCNVYDDEPIHGEVEAKSVRCSNSNCPLVYLDIWNTWDPNRPDGRLPDNPNTGDGNYSGGSSGGGGGGGSAGPNVTSPDGSTIARPNIPETFEKQLDDKSCVPTIMELVNHIFGGDKNEGYYALKYCSKKGIDYLTEFEGVYSDDITDFVSTFFKTTPFQSYTIAINNGHVIMTDIQSDIPNSRHNVLVIGYRPNSGNMVYLDPATGQRHENHASYFGQLYTIEITGNK